MVDNIIPDLRKLKPQKIEIDEVRDKLLKYGFSVSKFYKKISKNHEYYNHTERNLKGALFEAYIYEILLSWAVSIEDIDCFILKGPYLKSPSVSDGFGYKFREIVYLCDNNSIAEFDALFKFRKKWVIVEITLIPYKTNIKRKLEDLKRKKKILTMLTGSKDIISILITSEKKITKTMLNDLDINWVLPFNEDLMSLCPNLSSRYKTLPFPKNPKYCDITSLKFNQIKLEKREKKVKHSFIRYIEGETSSERFIEEIIEELSIVPRIYLGVLNKTSLQYFFEKNKLKDNYIELCDYRIKKIIVGIRFKPKMYAKLQLYFVPYKYQNKFYTLQWNGKNFSKTKSVLNHPKISSIDNPYLNPKDQSYRNKLANACMELKIPSLQI